jgi:putative membrane protein
VARWREAQFTLPDHTSAAVVPATCFTNHARRGALMDTSMTDADPATITARFNPLIRPYLVLYVAGLMTITIVFIPLALVWLLGVGQWWARHYFERLSCELGPRQLRFTKGIIFTVEKTIPLENIQDVTFIEGPLLRRFHLSILKFETAGQSVGQAHDMRLVGIIDAHRFRSLILERREALKRELGGRVATDGDSTEVLLLRQIGARLDEIAGLLRKP